MENILTAKEQWQIVKKQLAGLGEKIDKIKSNKSKLKVSKTGNNVGGRSEEGKKERPARYPTKKVRKATCSPSEGKSGTPDSMNGKRPPQVPARSPECDIIVRTCPTCNGEGKIYGKGEGGNPAGFSTIHRPALEPLCGGESNSTPPPKIKKWMIKEWGRCKDYCMGCGTCDAWKCFNFLTDPLNHDNPVLNAYFQGRKAERQHIIKELEKLGIGMAVKAIKEAKT